MIRMICVLAAFAILFTFSGCEDAAPGEISVIAMNNGRQQSCAVQLYNSDGQLINIVPTDIKGLVYIKKLAPGTYTLKFQDSNKDLYPAIKTVKVTSGDSNTCRVNLEEGPAEPAEETTP